MLKTKITLVGINEYRIFEINSQNGNRYGKGGWTEIMTNLSLKKNTFIWSR